MNGEASILSVLPEEKFKIVIVGESGVGKSTIFRSFIDEQEEDPTIKGTNLVQTIDFRIKNYIVEGQPTKFYIWDTAGQEKYRSMVSAYFKGCQAVLVVFDLTSKKSFEAALQVWVKLSREKTDNAVIILVGNKYDLTTFREVSTIEGEETARQQKLRYLETSGLDGHNVQALFTLAGKEIQRCLRIGFKQMLEPLKDLEEEEDYRKQAESIVTARNTISLEQIPYTTTQVKKEKQCSC